MQIDAKTIKPKEKGKSDFFSWRLYRWAKEQRWYLNVYAGTWNSFTGHDPDRPVLYIGERSEGWFSGLPLRQVCTAGAGFQPFAFTPAHHVDEWEDITDEFWADYMKRGVCAIHGDRAHKWIETETSRQCEYCGKRETKHVFFETVQRVTWA